MMGLPPAMGAVAGGALGEKVLPHTIYRNVVAPPRIEYPLRAGAAATGEAINQALLKKMLGLE